MVVMAHTLVAPPWSNGWSMVISSLLNEHFYVFRFMSFLSQGVYTTCEIRNFENLGIYFYSGLWKNLKGSGWGGGGGSLSPNKIFAMCLAYTRKYCTKRMYTQWSNNTFVTELERSGRI